jgi:hypothetical protein
MTINRNSFRLLEGASMAMPPNASVLGPLEGFLQSNLGRPWNKVFSELRQGLDVRKVTGRDLFNHLEGMIATECSIGADRKVYAYPLG